MAPRDPRPVRRQITGGSALASALADDEPVRAVFVAAGAALTVEERRAIECAKERGAVLREIGARAFARLRATPAEERILALTGAAPTASLSEVLAGPGAMWLLVDANYPGNAGFVIRNAEVSGAAGVVIDADFDRIARRDAVRSSLRADRLMPVFFDAALPVVEAATAAGRRVVAVEDTGQRAPWEIDLTGPALFVVGGEGSGIPDALLERADEVVRIPMAGFIPSYNLQAAVAAVAAERLRQLLSD